MKVLLTHTYFLAEDAHEQQIMKPYPPLGLLYLSAYLKENQIDVSVYDTTFSTYDELVRHIDEQRPAVLGIHCNLLTKFTVMRLIQHCQLRGIISILGGPDAATQVAEFLNYGADIIVSGEGEIPLLAVLKRLETHAPTDLGDIPNVSYKTVDGQVIQNPRQASRLRLDDFPLPDRDAIDLEKYLGTWEKYHGQRSISLITARGCAFTCKWCSHSVYGHTHRRRRPENVVAEIQSLVKRYRPTHLWFADDVFTVNKHWLKKFTGLMRDAGIHLPFECIARADKFDEEIAILLKDLGCYRVWFGAESGSQKILDAMSRGVTKAEIADATRWCQQNGLQAGYFVMFGYPGEAI
ncbi:MAG: B12-binding domain-containing radical SAM protein, partial [Calditrichaeota bacterium]|nr:B12-binding domain-containing radical SAM protein [Calditrichota bacterium]